MKVQTPWAPAKSASITRFINEIVCIEGSVVNELGEPKSHVEMYLDAMKQINADTSIINSFIQLIETGNSLEHALKINLDRSVAECVKVSFQLNCKPTT